MLGVLLHVVVVVGLVLVVVVVTGGKQSQLQVCTCPRSLTTMRRTRMDMMKKNTRDEGFDDKEQSDD